MLSIDESHINIALFDQMDLVLLVFYADIDKTPIAAHSNVKWQKNLLFKEKNYKSHLKSFLYNK